MAGKSNQNHGKGVLTPCMTCGVCMYGHSVRQKALGPTLWASRPEESDWQEMDIQYGLLAGEQVRNKGHCYFRLARDSPIRRWPRGTDLLAFCFLYELFFFFNLTCMHVCLVPVEAGREC